MKNIYILLFLLGFGLCACEKAIDSNLTKDEISISSDTLYFSAKGGKEAIKVTSSCPWRLAGHEEWIEISSESGNSGDEIIFNVSPNTTEDNKETTFKVIAGNSAVPVVVISASQPFLDIVGDNEITLDANQSELMIKTKTNAVDLKCVLDPEDNWIELTNRKDVLGYTYLTFTITPNSTFVNRTANIKLVCDDLEKHLSVIQLQKDVIIPEKNYFEYFDLEEKPITVNIKSNVEYKIEYDNNLISEVEIGEPTEKGDDGLYSKSISFQINKSESRRTVSMSFISNEITLATIKIKQTTPGQEYVVFSDDSFGQYLESEGIVLCTGEKYKYELSDVALEMSTLKISGSFENKLDIDTIDGLGSFPKLNTVEVDLALVKTINIEDCKNIISLKIENSHLVSEFRLGSNPISGLDFEADFLGYIESESVSISGEHIKFINMSAKSSYIAFYENCTNIDVSDCPELEELKAKREFQNWDTGEYGTKLQTIYITSAQKEKVKIEKCEQTEIVVKEN